MKTTAVQTAERGRSPLGAQIRFLADGPHGNMIHSTVPPGMVGRACRFRTIDEFWFVLSGKGDERDPRRLDPRSTSQGSLVVNSSQGGGTKDTWVLERGSC